MSLNLSLIMRLIARPGSGRGEQGQGGALADARKAVVADEARFQLASIPSDRDCADVKRMLGVLGIVCSAGSAYDPAYEAAEPPVERRVVHAGRYGVCYPIGQDPDSPLSSSRSGTRGAIYWPDSGSTDPRRVLPNRRVPLAERGSDPAAKDNRALSLPGFPLRLRGGFTHSCRRISAVVLVPRALSRLFAAQRSGWSLAANGRFALLEILRMYQLKKLFFRVNAELTVNVLDMGTSRSLRYHKFFANVLSVISCCQ